MFLAIDHLEAHHNAVIDKLPHRFAPSVIEFCASVKSAAIDRLHAF